MGIEIGIRYPCAREHAAGGIEHGPPHENDVRAADGGLERALTTARRFVMDIRCGIVNTRPRRPTTVKIGKIRARSRDF